MPDKPTQSAQPKPPRTTPAPVRHAPPPRYSVRNAGADRRNITSRSLAVRSGSYDESSRSFVSVVSTETRATVFDWERLEYVEEILVATGGEFPERCPLLDSHNRYRSADVIGSALDFKREGDGWIGRGVFAADDPEVDRIAARVRDGHITDVSIGYEVLAFTDIPAGQTQEINGRTYTAGGHALRVTTQWKVRELSVTPIGADEKAKIRNQNQQGGGRPAPRSHRSNRMNSRLFAYLRSLGLAANATDDEARAFMANLRGVERSLAGLLDYDEADTAARTSADLAIRSLGFDPADPTKVRSKSRRRGRREDEETDEEERRRRRREEEETDEEREGEEDEEYREDEETDEEREGEEDEEREGEEDEEQRGRRRRRSRRRTASVSRAEGARLERRRQSRLRQMAGELVPAATLERAISEGWSVSRAAPVFLQSIRDSRGAPLAGDVPSGAPAGHSRNSQTDFSRDALAAALMLRGGISDPVQRRYVYDPIRGGARFVDANRDGDYCRAVERGAQLRGLPQVEIARRALELDGVRVDPIPAQIVRAFNTRAATAPSVNAFLGIYTMVYGALLLESFDATEDTTAGWTIERENPNFMQNERHRITKGGTLTKHAKGGEAEHFTQADTTEYTRVHRYSAQSVFDEMDLINDTMFDALRTATPAEIGEAARQLRPDLVYGLLRSNPNLADSNPLFQATSGNLLYDSPFGKEALQAALTAIATQQENGRNLNLKAKYIVAPQAMNFDVVELIQSPTVVIAGNSDRTRPTMNAVSIQGLQPVFDSRLDNGVTDPNSGTTYAGAEDEWFVATPPNRHTIEVTYLRGSGRVPEMRSGILDRGQWGIWFDVKHDIGAVPLARLGIVKCTPDPEPT